MMASLCIGDAIACIEVARGSKFDQSTPEEKHQVLIV
jgi:hypothetical protein